MDDNLQIPSPNCQICSSRHEGQPLTWQHAQSQLCSQFPAPLLAKAAERHLAAHMLAGVDRAALSPAGISRGFSPPHAAACAPQEGPRCCCSQCSLRLQLSGTGRCSPHLLEACRHSAPEQRAPIVPCTHVEASDRCLQTSLTYNVLRQMHLTQVDLHLGKRA